MKMSELKAGMFCVINEHGVDNYCIVTPSTKAPHSETPSFAAIVGEAYGDIGNHYMRTLVMAFTCHHNYTLRNALRFDKIPSANDVENFGGKILYVKDDKASKIQARIDTLHSEINQLTQELNSL